MAGKTHDEYKSLVQTSGASEKRSKRGLMSKVLDPAGIHVDTTQPIIKGTTFKMKGFPQHVGVSPLRDDVPLNREGTRERVTRPEPTTKLGKWLSKHPKLDKGVAKARHKVKVARRKIEEFAGSETGKAVIKGLTERTRQPRPKKEIVAIIEGEQKSIM